MKKIIKILGVLFLISLLLVGFGLYNMFSQYSKLSEGTLVSDIITDTIPFRYASTGHILIDVKVNGSEHAYPFVLDNGASNFIFSNHVDDVGAEMNGRGIGQNANGNLFWSNIRKLKELQIGNSKILNTNAKEVDFNFDCMEDVYGLIGAGTMRHLIWQVDFSNHTIVVSQNLSDLAFQENAVEMGVSENAYSHHLRTILHINDNEKGIQVILDLGNSGYLKLKESEILEKTSGLRYKKISGQASKGLGSSDNDAKKAHQAYYFAENIRLGKTTVPIRDLTILTAEGGGNLLGLGFFKRYKTTFSWKDKLMILEPLDSADSFRSSSFGFKLAYDKEKQKTLVRSVIDETPASRLGLEVGMEVTSINGKDISSMNAYCQNKGLIYTEDTIKVSCKKDASLHELTLVKETLF